VHALVLTLLVRSNNHLQLERAAAAAAAAHISSSSSGLNSSSSSSNADPKCLLLRSKALHVPPLPPDFGRIRTSFSTAIPTAGGGSRPSEWRPKQVHVPLHYGSYGVTTVTVMAILLIESVHEHTCMHSTVACIGITLLSRY
jgi:hypothetical protein